MDIKYSINKNVFFDETIEGIYILSEDGEVYLIRDDVGKTIWSKLCTTPCSETETVDYIISSFFGESKEQVELDVREFLHSLKSIGAIIEWNA